MKIIFYLINLFLKIKNIFDNHNAENDCSDYDEYYDYDEEIDENECLHLNIFSS